jgi:hypothetical protein
MAAVPSGLSTTPLIKKIINANEYKMKIAFLQPVSSNITVFHSEQK